MFIRTQPSSAGISLEASVPTKDRPIATREAISFGLLPTEERDHLDLDTGEVFQDYIYARLDKKKKKKKKKNLIGASMTIRPLPDESYYEHNTMQYFSEQTGDDFYSPASIYFTVFIEPTAFRELADKIKSGLYPETITIELARSPRISTDPQRKPPIEFGWEPDGSGKIWHNTEKENRKIAIESVSFDYAPIKSRHDEKVDRPLPIEVSAPADRINERIAVMQTSLAQMLKYARWITIGVAAIAIMTAILMIKRGMLF
jgi:hypothetical protein